VRSYEVVTIHELINRIEELYLLLKYVKELLNLFIGLRIINPANYQILLILYPFHLI